MVKGEGQEELQKELKEKARIFINIDRISMKERSILRVEFLEEPRVRRIAQRVSPGKSLHVYKPGFVEGWTQRKEWPVW